MIDLATRTLVAAAVVGVLLGAAGLMRPAAPIVTATATIAR